MANITILSSKLGYLEAKDQFKWYGNFDELVTLVKTLLGASCDGAISSDPTHNLFVYKTDAVIVKWYSTTNTLQTQGSDFTTLREKLRKLFDAKDEQLVLQATGMDMSGSDDSSSAAINISTPLDIESSNASPHKTKCGGCSVVESKLLNLEKQFEILRNSVPLNDNIQIMDQNNHTLKQQNNELSRKNDELNMNLKAAEKKIRDLENERLSLITALRLLHEELNTNDSGKKEHPANSIQPEWQDVPYSKTTKSKTQIPKERAPSSSTREATKPSKNTKKQPSEPQPERSSITNSAVIIGDSIIKHLQGYKMKKRAGCNVFIRSFPGAQTADIADYIKPTVRNKPKSIIIHTGTNDIQTKSPQQVADSLVDIAQNINHDHPHIEIAFSQIINRSDDANLNPKIADANKRLQKFCAQRGWGWISNDNIDESHLNRSGLHLNMSGTKQLATNMLKYLSRQN
ncbi:uncharacterized protein LOC144633825 [Oculina patagonica]